MIETLYCSICSAMQTNLIIYFGNETKKHGRDNYMRYVFKENILEVLKPLDLTFDIDSILDLLTSDFSEKQSKQMIRNLFNSMFNVTLSEHGKHATYTNTNDYVLIDNTNGIDSQ